MKKIFLSISLTLFILGQLAVSQASAITDSAVDAIRDAVQDTNDAVIDAAESIPPAPSPIYGGDFFNEGNSDRYSLGNVVDNLLPGVARWIAGFLAALAVIFLIYAGILYLTAGGEEEKITEATKTAFYVLVGLLLTMFAYVLVYLFLSLFNP